MSNINSQMVDINGNLLYPITTASNVSGLAGQLSNLANKDFSNITSSAKTDISKYPMPSLSYTTLTATNNNSYTAPANGWYAIRGTSTSAYHHYTFENTTNSMAVRNSGYGAGAMITNFIPVKSGDEVKLTLSNIASTTYFRFYYAEGEV